MVPEAEDPTEEVDEFEEWVLVVEVGLFDFINAVVFFVEATVDGVVVVVVVVAEELFLSFFFSLLLLFALEEDEPVVFLISFCLNPRIILIGGFMKTELSRLV